MHMRVCVCSCVVCVYMRVCVCMCCVCVYMCVCVCVVYMHMKQFPRMQVVAQGISMASEGPPNADC